jgi:hypothetical protein
VPTPEGMAASGAAAVPSRTRAAIGATPAMNLCACRGKGIRLHTPGPRRRYALTRLPGSACCAVVWRLSFQQAGKSASTTACEVLRRSGVGSEVDCRAALAHLVHDDVADVCVGDALRQLLRPLGAGQRHRRQPQRNAAPGHQVQHLCRFST